jgi:tetratricopeptide (TPR) repeat protein
MFVPVSSRQALAWGALAALVAGGCAPTSKALRREIEQGAPGAHVAGVPFVRQRRDWCGPAALASLARHYGLELTQEQIAQEVYLPSIGGTLTVDLQRCAQRHGLWCHSGRGTPDDVREWLDRGVPLVVLLRLGPLAGRNHHYAVVTGYHGQRGYFIAHTGRLSNRPIAFRRLAQQMRDAGGWFLAACPPERVNWPLTADGHNDLGLLFERAGKVERARSEYKKAIAAESGRAVFHFNLGNAQCRLGKRAAAERAYREAIRLEPAFADAHNNLASLLIDLGRHHEAYREARRAVEIDGPRAAYYYDTLGRALTALGGYPAAARAFRRAIKEAGNDEVVAADARLGLIEALVRSGARNEAMAERDRLLASTSDPALRRQATALLE